MTKKIITVVILTALLSSCVSKKKYVELEQNLSNTRGELQKTTLQKEELEGKFAKIEQRVVEYNSKINSLKDQSSKQMNSVGDNLTVISQNTKDKMSAALSKIPPEELAGAKTLKDSMDVAVSYKLRKAINTSEVNDDSGLKVDIDKTVVMISVADSLLFRSGSYRISSKAYPTLKKLADVINSEPSMDVMIEGHTDARSINTEGIQDNWDLSVKRATAIVRLLQNKYKVDPTRLIPSGRSSYVPLVDNETRENRARNRRTNIIILPNLNKFFGLLADEEQAAKSVEEITKGAIEAVGAAN